jgi:hypothetical protein
MMERAALTRRAFPGFAKGDDVMRLVKITAPAGTGEKLIETAFSAGIKRVSSQQALAFEKDGSRESLDVVDFEASTPAAKRFVDRLLAAEYYDPKKISFSTKEPRSIISSLSIRKRPTRLSSRRAIFMKSFGSSVT